MNKNSKSISLDIFIKTPISPAYFGEWKRFIPLRNHIDKPMKWYFMHFAIAHRLRPLRMKNGKKLVKNKGQNWALPCSIGTNIDPTDMLLTIPETSEYW